MSGPELSLCMIVRDEAAMLPGFLASVAGLWDELVVADTGSNDASRDLIRAAGGRVIEHSWGDDFAAARNASLAVARGRWILCLDADERVDSRLAGALRDLVATDARAGAATVVMRNELPDGGRREARLLRCFRNVPEIRFRHRIHEDVADDVDAWLKREGLALRHLDGGVDHLGYVRSHAAARDKKARDTALLRLALTDDPDDLYCRFKLLELARFWDDQELWVTEADAARRALERTPRARLAGRRWSGELAVLIAQALPARPQAKLAWLDAQARRVEPGPAWHLRRGLLLEDCGRWDEAATAYETGLAAGAMTDGLAPELPAARPLLGLCRLAARRGEVDAAAQLALRAVADSPRDPEALLAAVSFLTPSAADEFARRHALAQPATATMLARSLLTCGRPEAALDLLERAASGGDAIGVLVLALAMGLEREIELEQASPLVDGALRAWLQALWGSGRADLCQAFAERAGLLAGAFPWLEDWLAARGAEVSPSRR